MIWLLGLVGIYLIMESGFQRHAGYAAPARVAAVLGWVLLLAAIAPMVASASCGACMGELFRPGTRLP